MPGITHRNGKKLAAVFRDSNGSWMAASLPFPSLELYGCTEDGDGNCTTREVAVRSAEEAGCEVVSDEEAKTFI